MSDNSDATLFAERMEYCAAKVGNAARLSRESGISRRAIGDYLAGRAEPSRPRLVAIAKAAGVCVEWLATGEGPRLPSEIRVQHIGFDRELFEECWQTIDALLDALGEKKTSKERMDLVFQAYDECIVEKADGGRGLDMANVIKLVRKAG